MGKFSPRKYSRPFEGNQENYRRLKRVKMSQDSSCIKLTLELKLELGPPEMPKVFVVSHERSGTHFLMNTLELNFGYVADPWVNLDTELGINFFSPVAFRSFVTMFEGRSIRNLFKSHHEFGFYKELVEYMVTQYRILYIYREIDELMASMQRYLERLPWHEGPKMDCFEDFSRTQPFGAMQRYQYAPATSMMHRWENHVDGWLNAIDHDHSGSMIAIRYEDLNNHFENTTHQISQFLCLPLIGDAPLRPSRERNVIEPPLPHKKS